MVTIRNRTPGKYDEDRRDRRNRAHRVEARVDTRRTGPRGGGGITDHGRGHHHRPGQGRGYFRAKLAQEDAVKAAPIPGTIMRATQFFEFIGRIADSGTHDGTVALPPLLFQPEAAGDVATALAGKRPS